MISLPTAGRAAPPLWLSCVAGLQKIYTSDYAGMHAQDEGERPAGAGSQGFRCSPCYHLFGVDLIADANGAMHVIEVNVEPDLTLSTEGAACMAEGANCTGGSKAYDHTKRAAAFNTVSLVYSRQAQARRLQSLLERHAARISALELLVVPPPPPLPLSSDASAGRGAAVALAGDEKGVPPPVLRAEVAEYLLDWLRETEASGCFTLVYPSRRHHGAHAAQLARMHSGAQRMQMHQLLGIVLEDAALANDASVGANAFRSRCERMLHDVPHVKQGAWARRTHIFKEVWDL